MAQDWDIKPRGAACYGCETAFEDRQGCYSTLSLTEEGYARRDFCDTCWSGGAESGEWVSTWQGVFRVPPAAPEPALRKETAESLLRRLMEDDDPAKANVIYILAVMLERNRVFVERNVQTREDDVLIRVYEHKKTGETFLVSDPRLRLDELEVVQEQVVTMLGGKPRIRGPEGDKPAPAEKGPPSGEAEPAEELPEPSADDAGPRPDDELDDEDGLDGEDEADEDDDDEDED